MTAATARVPAHVVYRMFAQETVVLNLNTGRYHGLNPTAGTMLTALERHATVGEAAAWLAAHYEQPLEEIERRHTCALPRSSRSRADRPRQRGWESARAELA